MRILNLPGGKEIKIRETPKELPINRYTDHQKYLIQAAGIGSNMGHVEAHFSRLHRLIAAGLMEDAGREAYNLHYNIHLMLNKINVDSIAFACLVDEVDGVTSIDYSEQGLIDLCQRMGELGLTFAMVSEILSDVKKNSILL